MRIVAVRQLCGDYGVLAPGQEAFVRDDFAKDLVKRGCAREWKPAPPPAAPVAAPAEVKPAMPSELAVAGPSEVKAVDQPLVGRQRGRG